MYIYIWWLYVIEIVLFLAENNAYFIVENGWTLICEMLNTHNFIY